MNEQKRFRILTPDGLLSPESYLISAVQPPNIKSGCLLVVDQQSGRRITVHESRIFPAEAAAATALDPAAMSVCLKCGRVEGVVEDQVTCPHHDDAACGLMAHSREDSSTPIS